MTIEVILRDIYLGCILVSAFELIIGGSALSEQGPLLGRTLGA